MMTRRTFLRRLTHVTLGLGLAGTYPTFIEPRRLQTTHIPVPIPGLPRALHGLRIAHLTDLHRSRYVSTQFLHNAVAQANALDPHITVFTGDYLTHGQSPKGRALYGQTGNADQYAADCARVIGQARARYGVFASLGNHDHWYDADRVTELITQAGIPVLRNAGTTLHIHNEPLNIIGLGDLWTEGVNLPRAFAGRPQAFNLILMHNPDTFEQWNLSGRHLILAGHTHGGQVNVPFYGAPCVPSQYGDKYAHGLFTRDQNQTQMYVNRGVGTIFPAVRFNCRPEIALLELYCA